MNLVTRYSNPQAKALVNWFRGQTIQKIECSFDQGNQTEGENPLQNGFPIETLFQNRIFTLPNNANLVFGKPQEGSIDLVIDRKDLDSKKWQVFENCLNAAPWVIAAKHFDPAKALLRPADAQPVRWHVLMNTSMIDEKWCRPALKGLIQPEDEVCVLAFSFFDDTKNLADWNKQYQKGQGIWYRANTDVFFWYGLKEKQVHWVNYFTDDINTMKDAIRNSNILLLTGGAPDLMMKRIKEKKLKKVLKEYEGLVIGYSAGAMIQLDDYHITPDEDYPRFDWQKGIGWLNDFDVEVHYAHSRIQKEGMNRAYAKDQKPIYAIEEQGGMIVSPDGSKSFFGKVECFDENHPDYGV